MNAYAAFSDAALMLPGSIGPKLPGQSVVLVPGGTVTIAAPKKSPFLQGLLIVGGLGAFAAVLFAAKR